MFNVSGYTEGVSPVLKKPVSHKAHFKKWIHHCRLWADCSESEISASIQKGSVCLQEELQCPLLVQEDSEGYGTGRST